MKQELKGGIALQKNRPLRGGRGLKQELKGGIALQKNRPLRGGRGLKHAVLARISPKDNIAPFAGGAD